jgi:hypothetical protein
MNKFIAIALFFGLFSGLAGAHHMGGLVNIKHADKVIVKGGKGHHHKIGKMMCKLAILEGLSQDQAEDKAIKHVQKICDKLELKHCKKFKKHVVMAVTACYAKHKLHEIIMKSAAAPTK